MSNGSSNMSSTVEWNGRDWLTGRQGKVLEMLPQPKNCLHCSQRSLLAANASANGGELYKAGQNFWGAGMKQSQDFTPDGLNNLGNIHFQPKSAADIGGIWSHNWAGKFLQHLIQEFWNQFSFMIKANLNMTGDIWWNNNKRYSHWGRDDSL